MPALPAPMGSEGSEPGRTDVFTLHGSKVADDVSRALHATAWRRRLEAGRGSRWAALIEQALAWPHGPQPDSIVATLDFMRYTLERSRQNAVLVDGARGGIGT
ncbi:MAG: hypothetical protein L6435_18990 [Anaerolineae bacterium]|nr:hypothetical protein [Anaerolineae bacterium]